MPGSVNERQPALLAVPRRTLWGALLLIPALCGLASLALGKDINWDLRNYHYYNPYAFLNGRMGLDLAPAQLQSYHNPLIDLPFYGISTLLPAPVAGFVLGALHGLNVSLLFLLAWSTCRLAGAGFRILLALAVALFACAAPAFILELGTSFGDNLVSLLVLAAPLVILRASRPGKASGREALVGVAAAGALMGAAVGLKPTTAVFALGLSLALLTLDLPWRRRAKVLLVYSLAGCCGALVTWGHWLWRLWREFGNPVLPYWNQFFRAPAVWQVSYGARIYERFGPQELWEYLAWPVVFSFDSSRVASIAFQDVRFTLVYLALLVFAVARLSTWWRGQPPAGSRHRWFDTAAGNLVLAFFGFSFVIWMLTYAFYRFILPLELLAPLVFLLLLDRLGLRPRHELVAALAAAAITLFLLRPATGDRAAWTSEYVDVDLSGIEVPQETLVVMLGWEPMAFVVPEFPAHVRFIRPDGNLQLTPEHALYQEMARVVRRHEGTVYIMHGPRDDADRLAAMASVLGGEHEGNRCRLLPTEPAAEIFFCRVR